MSSNPFEEIRARLSVVDVVGGYITIKGSGSSYKACCPFHNEKSPSLMISESKGVWHCFGCGLGGDIFKFVMLYENVEKKDALRILAKKAGVELEPLKPKTIEEKVIEKEKTSRFEQGLKYLDWSTKIYHQILLKIIQQRDNPITQYCLERGYDIETIKKFQLGYAPKGDFVVSQATQHRMSLELLLEISLLKKTEQGQFKDKFTDRLMVPIFDRQGKSVGFTGRILPYDTNPNRPKYLNSSQSEWFNKSDLWYGWNLNASSIRQNKKSIIVEGNMDVIKATQSGFDYTLASQGTSFTANQLKSLKQITKVVHLAFDNDVAGRTSSRKFFVEATAIGLNVQKMIIPENYKDLDEAFNGGYKDFRIIPFLDYWLELHKLDLVSTDATLQKNAIVDVLDLFAVLDPVSREQYFNKLSAITKISQRTLQMQMSSVRLAQPPTPIDSTESNLSTTQISKERLVQITFQKLSVTLDNYPLLCNLFLLLRVLIVDFREFVDFDSWQTLNREELDLVKENLNSDSSAANLILIIQQYLNSNVGQFLMDENLKRIYSEVNNIRNQIANSKLEVKENL
jgi:DNA primase